MNWLRGPKKTKSYSSNDESQNRIPQSPLVQKWVAADTSGCTSEAKDRTGWESKKQLENGTTTMGN